MEYVQYLLVHVYLVSYLYAVLSVYVRSCFGVRLQLFLVYVVVSVEYLSYLSLLFDYVQIFIID